ncbi:6-phosphogluconate dehydrogenase [Amylocarpus encephaloides]|uniref:phosphogluconate dehydrogenase (NADP(+)-dependent, decarboxylating) n=1 Tax=Amylocarpus encephaloides TaxID=45428 RepID=A0A9P7YHR2_9HELO|nr:6-phosphogluconate dehydrogenase [Amylocarpus encephaloides]
MSKHKGMYYDAIGKVFEKWSSEGELNNTFPAKIGADTCQQKDKIGNHVRANVQGKVVQNIDGLEGTGIRSNTQATLLHVSASSLSAAHHLRKVSFCNDNEKGVFTKDLRITVYTTCQASYVQGIRILDVADKENKWAINYHNIVQIWKAGCNIQLGHIHTLLGGIFHPNSENHNLFH